MSGGIGFGAFATIARRGAAAGEGAARAAAGRVAAAARVQMPGVAASLTEAAGGAGVEVRLRGRGLVRRWMDDAATRWIGGWLR